MTATPGQPPGAPPRRHRRPGRLRRPGRHRRPGPRRLRDGLLAGLLVVLAGIGSFVALPATSVGAAPGQEGDTPQPDPGPPTMTLVSRPPWVGATDAVPFRFSFGGDTAGATLRFRIHRPLRSMDELRESAEEDVGTVRFRSEAIPLATRPEAAAPTAAVEQTIAVKTVTETTDDPFTARLTRPGIHPVVFELYDEEGNLAATIRTPVLRLPADDDEPVPAPDLVVLLDLAAPPSLRPDGTRELDDTSLDRLLPVAQVLADHPDLPLTVAARPDTLDALAISADRRAAAVLAAVDGRRGIGLPYLPVAVGSLRRHGLRGLLPVALQRGNAVQADALGTAPIGGIWDPVAQLTPADAELLAGSDVHSLLGWSRTAGRDTGGRDDGGRDAPWQDLGPVLLPELDPLVALRAETELSARLADPLPSPPGSPPAADAAHVLLAELLLRTPEPEPDTPTVPVLIRPGTLDSRAALAALLDLIDDPRSPVSLVPGRRLATSRFRVAPGGDDADEPDPSEPDPSEPADSPIRLPGRRPPDLGRIADALVEAIGDLETFAALVGDESARATDLQLHLLTAITTSTGSTHRRATLDAARESLRTAFLDVHLAGETALNLTSRRGTLPVTVANDNDFTVHTVLRFRSDRLAFPEGDALQVTVPPGGARVDIPVEALATGSVPVFVELWTLGDGHRLDSRQLDVRSTAISGAGLAISLGALVVLGAWWFRSWRRNRDSDRARTGAEPDDPVERVD